jgi:PPOX class probable F420-dependent enzyme
MQLPDRFVELMRGPNPCFITTFMPDGSPQTTQTWVDTGGEHVIINTVQTHQKMRNVRRDPRVSLAVCDAAELSRYFAVRGNVSNITTDGGAEHIELLSQRYTGGPYQPRHGSLIWAAGVGSRDAIEPAIGWHGQLSRKGAMRPIDCVP